MRYYLSFMAALLLIAAHYVVHYPASSQPASLDDLYQQQLVEFQQQTGVGNDIDDAAFFLRNLVYRDDSVEFAALWEGGERVFPSSSGMTTWVESGLLTELLPVMNAVRADSALQWQRLYLSSGLAWVNCSAMATETVVCLAFSERALNAGGVILPTTGSVVDARTVWPVVVAGLIAALLILMLHARLHWLRKRIDEALHDLRLPLANIGLYLTLLQRNTTNRLPHMDVLESEQQRAVQLTESLLESTDCRSSSYTVVSLWKKSNLLKASDVQDLLQARIAVWRPALANANIRVSVESSSIPLRQMVCGDMGPLVRILDNLLDNSCRHSAGGQLRIWLVSNDNSLELRWLCERKSDHQNIPMRWRAGIGLRSCLWQVRVNGWRCQQWREGRRYRLAIGMPWAPAMKQPDHIGGECHV